MENKKRLSFDDPSAAASALRRLTRTPTGQRLNLRRSSTTSSTSATSSVSSVSSAEDETPPLSCVSRNTSSDDCALYRFIVWAAVKRNECQKMTIEERRECPLLRCRKRFPNHELMLSHLYTCDHLSGGEYWCYDCGRAEKLNDAKCKRCLGHPSKRRKLMSMAKKVFGSLGHRPKNGNLSAAALNLNVDDEPPSYDSVFTPAHVELPSNEIHEIDSNEIALPTIPECENESEPDSAPRMLSMLQSQYTLAHGPQSENDPQPPDLEAGFINWEPSPSPPSTVEPQNLLRPNPGRLMDRPALQVHTHGLDQYRPQAKRRSKTLAPSSSVRSTSSTDSTDSTSSTASYNISPMSGWSGGWARAPGFESTLTSPCDDLVSPADVFPVNTFAGSYKPMGFSDSELDNIVANPFLSELPAEIPTIDIDLSLDPLQDSLSLDQPSFSFDATIPLQLPVESNLAMTDSLNMPQPSPLTPDITGASLATAQSLVVSAQDTLQMHIAESMAKLSGLSSNPLANGFCSMPPASVALAGLKTMHDVLEGRQAASPLNLLCFIHVVFSLSLVVHEQDIENRCAGLFKQALLYSFWFSNHDRSSYIEAVYSLWKPNQVSDTDIINLLRAGPAGFASGSASGKGKEPERSLQGLRSDPLVLVAQYFLDELDYLTLHDVSQPAIQASELAVHHIKDGFGANKDIPFGIAAKYMIESGFSRQYSDVPGFVSSMRTLINQLNTGQISTVRRLELEMMQAGKMFLPSGTFFDAFIDQTRRQVDTLYAVHGANYFSSRSTYHQYGVKLMELLIGGGPAAYNQARSQNLVQAGPTAGSIDEFIGTIPDNFDFNAMMNFGTPHDANPINPHHLPAALMPSSVDMSDWQSTPASDISGSIVGQGGDSLAAHTPSSASASVSAPPQPPPPPGKPDLSSRTNSKSSPSNKAEAFSSAKVESNSCCEICGYRPKGDPRWFGGSMAKHKKLQHSEETKIYRCPYPGCTSQYSKRPDNLRQHQIEKGHFVDGQGASNRRTRKRKWTPEPK
ncbi:hypothetical protein PT974_00706 [Cladobotryum mycophilum]|uniref:C2H2-type domain-containing protein n=1 Tax=Cladobotryum mycophilum TaxID=491253 RepID=A0ABR0T2G3_9HYPO